MGDVILVFLRGDEEGWREGWGSGGWIGVVGGWR